MKDNFLSTISHELKTPLTSIKMYSEFMNSGRAYKPEKIVSHTSVILKEASRLESLIDAILNYARMESGKQLFRWETLNLSECANKVCDSLDVIAKSKGLEIKREIEKDLHIMGDYPSIYSLIQNLVDNAIKYTAEGHVFVRLQAISQGISLSVEDTGKGIPASEQKNIFEGFYRIGDESTRETKGSGLGLAIVKRTADAHKASITLKSSPGKGSAFTVVFKN
jgi:signal transduction histidine kinase